MNDFGVVAPRQNPSLWKYFWQQVSGPKGIESAPRILTISLKAVDEYDTNINEHSFAEERGNSTRRWHRQDYSKARKVLGTCLQKETPDQKVDDI